MKINSNWNGMPCPLILGIQESHGIACALPLPMVMKDCGNDCGRFGCVASGKGFVFVGCSAIEAYP